MAVTMQDIARGLNVSVVTVSKVLRNKGKISAATRKRVLRRAKELNYQTNWIARSLVTRRTFTIGLLLPDFTHPFFAEIAKAVAETVRPHGYHVIISYFEENPELERNEAESLLARQVDGLIMASAQSGSAAFRHIQKRKVPFVLIDRPIAGVRASFVGVDNAAIGNLATAHLIERGCRHIAHLRGPGIGIATGRMEGYRQALAKHGLPFCPNYIIEAGYQDHTGHEAMRQLLQTQPAPDGVFCYNDPVAIGAIRAISEAGLKVPDDIAVVGAGNVHYSDFLAVPLTTVDQGTSEMGRRAADLLVEQIAAKRTQLPKKVLIEPRLVIRRSTERPSS
ncbi:MAG TPA: LacI family DNA-binding transcriptional regulator [Terriglobales bacterium]|jgi:LacI family transcriptional regulator|nr:LacI family DNA-binding transcriptional regulator [Terriglobales bacterium]